jgi:hypothetical protein
MRATRFDRRAPVATTLKGLFMSFLTKTLIVAVNDTEYDVEPVPEWGGDVRVRSLSGAERTTLRLKGEAAESWDALVGAMGIVDEKGANLFTQAESTILAKKHPLIMERIARRILDLSTLTKEAREEAEKKQSPTLIGSGGTSSLEPSTPATDSTLTDSSETPPSPV